MSGKVPPCPKCGSHDVRARRHEVIHGFEYFVMCADCGMQGPRVWRYGAYDKGNLPKAYKQWDRMCERGGRIDG